MAAFSDQPVESRILNEIAEVARKIAELEQERSALQRLLLKVRREGVAATVVTRRDSVPRLLIEKIVLEALGRAKNKSLSSAELFRQAQLIDYTLKNNTFRSQLHRMKTSLLIVNSSHGYWKLP